MSNHITKGGKVILWSLAVGLVWAMADGEAVAQRHGGRHNGPDWSHGGHHRNRDGYRDHGGHHEHRDSHWPSSPSYVWPESTYWDNDDYYDYYAAIAYSPSTGRHGYSYGYTSLCRAKNEALRRCAEEDAQVVAWSRNGWCALALGDKLGAYGWSWSGNRQGARNRALEECSTRTTNCYIAVCVYSGN